MSSKKQIAEQVLRILAGGTPRKDFPIDIREVMYAVEQERDSMIHQYLVSAFTGGDYHVAGHFITKESALTINTNATTSERFVNLSYTPLTLHDDRGIHEVLGLNGGQLTPVVRVPNGSSSLYFGLQGGGNFGADAYELEGKILNIHEAVLNSLQSINVSYIAATRDLSQDINMPMPAELESKLVKSLVQLFGIMLKQDVDYEDDLING